MKQTIAIQGQAASFHDIAAAQIFAADSARVYCETFADTFQAVGDKRADYAVCAIENSLYGSINEVYDLLLAHHLVIVNEVYVRVEQCLIGLPGTRLEQVEKVYSHPIALAQCEAFLDSKLAHAEREEYHDTAASVSLVKDKNDPSVVAIASKQAAELHGLEVLASSIETNKENYTRFVALAEAAAAPAGQNKTSLLLELSNAPGSLYAVLGVFAQSSINLSKLQSRPVVGKAWHYIFYVDIEVGAQDPLCKQALAEIESLGCAVTVLGSYVAGNQVVG